MSNKSRERTVKADILLKTSSGIFMVLFLEWNSAGYYDI
jgi:hypothetical protein